MIFKFNNIELSEASDFKITSPIVGLSTPDIRIGDGEWSGRDGGYISSQFYSARVIVLSGFYIGDTCEEADAMRKELAANLPIRVSIPLFITDWSGNRYITETYLRDLKMDMIASKHGVFQITLVCPDPLLYDAGDGINPDSGWQEQDVFKLIGGGYITEYDMPVQWTPGTQPAAIVNAGDSQVLPQIKISGSVTNPRITNLSANKFIQINIVTSASDEIIIDMHQRIILLNGSSILALRTTDSTWWGLNPGTNIISYESASDLDADSVVVRWRDGYAGI